jgi:hypothetical protein
MEAGLRKPRRESWLFCWAGKFLIAEREGGTDGEIPMSRKRGETWGTHFYWLLPARRYSLVIPLIAAHVGSIEEANFSVKVG